MDKIKEQLKILPSSPGCYQFFDEQGEIIYIGKAKNLKKRVLTYFQRHHDSPKLQVMVPQIADIKYLLVDSEIEALILESQLIKKHKPKYNILLKDDKKFPYFVMTQEEYPRIVIARKANRNPIKGKYWGPYTDARAMYATLEILQKIFPIKKCKTPKFSSRPCLYYDMGQCLAPCKRLVEPDDYKKMLKDIELFLSGKQKELIEILKEQMYIHSQKCEFEKAKLLRDAINDIDKTLQIQKVVFENAKQNEDYISVAKSDKTYCVCILEIREGRLIGKKDFEFEQFTNNDDSTISDTILREYYLMLENIQSANKIYISNLPQDTEFFQEWLSEKFNKKVDILIPKTKKQKELMELSYKNAQNALEKTKIRELTELQNDYNQVGSWIAEKLNLSTFPHLIECYDISHIQGTNTVASKVVFYQGQPKKSLYRKYKIKTLKTGEVDDFKSMREVLSRRFKRIISGQDKAPDLIIIDGGKGQLSSVVGVADELNLKLNIVSLAKREEEIFTPKSKIPVIFPVNSPALFLFQRIRDEAHRFAITYHRNLRNKSLRNS